MIGQTEEWKQYKTRYSDIEISNLGNVRGTIKGKNVNTKSLTIVNGRRILCGRRLYYFVWELFVGPIPKGYCIHHKDFNKLNDRLNNLEMMTDSEHHRLHAEHKTFTQESRNKISQKLRNNKNGINNKSISGRIHINNGVINKIIYPEELDMYLIQGFKPGRIYSRKNKRNSDYGVPFFILRFASFILSYS